MGQNEKKPRGGQRKAKKKLKSCILYWKKRDETGKWGTLVRDKPYIGGLEYCPEHSEP